jgi:hypothetical protein
LGSPKKGGGGKTPRPELQRLSTPTQQCRKLKLTQTILPLECMCPSMSFLNSSFKLTSTNFIFGFETQTLVNKYLSYIIK